VAAAGAVTRVIETEVRQLRGVFFFFFKYDNNYFLKLFFLEIY
jgi:hypothetical protein